MEETKLEEFDNDYVVLTKKKVFWNHFAKLKKDCQVILNLTFKELTDLEIALTLGMKDKEDVIKRRSRCKYYLMQSVRKDPLFDEISAYA